MSFLETPRFPELVSAAEGWQGGPGFHTDVIVVESGREQRNAAWTYPRFNYDAAHAASLPAAYKALVDFFLIAGGMANGFRVKDWFDYAATASEGRFLEIDATHFQMVKRYTVGSSTRDRVISKPIGGSIVTTGGSVSAIDSTTGIVTMTSGTPLTWAGPYDVPCRFGVDEIRGSIIDRHRGTGQPIMRLESVPIIEIRI